MTQCDRAVRFETCYYASLCWYALGRLGFQAKGAPAIDKAQAARLSNLAEQFGFRAPVAGGPLFALVYQIPSYLNPDSTEAMGEILSVVTSLVCNRHAGGLLSRWPEQAARWLSWYTELALNRVLDSAHVDADRVCAALDEWTAYLRDLWPRYQGVFADRIASFPFSEYEEHCSLDRAFELWEGSFDTEYPYDKFVVVACPENLTLASSLGPGKVVIGTAAGWALVRHSTIHEIGVRFLAGRPLETHPTLAAALLEDSESVLRLIEAEVCHRKISLFPGLGEDLFMKGMVLESLAAWRATQELRGPFHDWFATLYVEARRDGVV
jgi:hypothetical protein